MYKVQSTGPAVTLNGFPSPEDLNEKQLAFMCETGEKERRCGTKEDRKSLKVGKTLAPEGGTRPVFLLTIYFPPTSIDSEALVTYSNTPRRTRATGEKREESVIQKLAVEGQLRWR